MKSYFQCILILLLLPLQTVLNGELEEKVQQAAQKTADAFIKGDYETVVKMTLPVVVKSMGGKEKMIAFLKKGMADMKKQGVAFDSVRVAAPKALKEINKVFYTIVPQTLYMQVPGGRLIQKSYMAGCSFDEGDNWYFVDIGNTDKEKLKMILPDLVDHIEIPPAEQPVYIENR